MRCAKPANSTRSAQVDPRLEIAEITDRVVKAGGPALLFTDVKGSKFPVLTNQFGTQRRMAMALDAGPSRRRRRARSLADRIRAARRVARRESRGADAPRTARQRDSQNGSRRQRARRRHEDARISPNLPILTTWPLDGGPFITLPLVITKDPRTNRPNVGMYRMQVYNATRDRDALATPQARARARRRVGSEGSGRGRDRMRSGAHVRRDRTASADSRRVRICRTAARKTGRATSVQRPSI